jgi:hypothetical protein
MYGNSKRGRQHGVLSQPWLMWLHSTQFLKVRSLDCLVHSCITLNVLFSHTELVNFLLSTRKVFLFTARLSVHLITTT